MPCSRFVKLFLFLTWPVCLFAQGGSSDALTLATIKARAGAAAVVPVVLTDNLGSPLGADAGAAAQIQALGFQVRWSPEDAVSAAECRRSGVAANLTPLFEHSTSVGPVVGYVSSYDLSAQPLSGLFPKGAEVAQLRLVVSSQAKPGSRISLSFVPEKTFVSNQDGSGYEHQNAGTLTLGTGTIKISNSPSMPILNVSVLTGSVKEGKTARFKITSSIKVQKSLRVSLVSSGDAVKGEDYKDVKKTTIAAGKRSTIVKIKIKKDKNTEPMKTLNLSIKNSRAYSILSPNLASAAITD